MWHSVQRMKMLNFSFNFSWYGWSDCERRHKVKVGQVSCCRGRSRCTCVRGPRPLVAVFVYVHHNGALPAKGKVTSTCSKSNGYAEPGVIGHEYQHEEVANDNLDHMKQCLEKVRPTQQTRPETGTNDNYRKVAHSLFTSQFNILFPYFYWFDALCHTQEYWNYTMVIRPTNVLVTVFLIKYLLYMEIIIAKYFTYSLTLNSYLSLMTYTSTWDRYSYISNM